jgi:hypothetical protein
MAVPGFVFLAFMCQVNAVRKCVASVPGMVWQGSATCAVLVDGIGHANPMNLAKLF